MFVTNLKGTFIKVKGTFNREKGTFIRMSESGDASEILHVAL